MSSFNNWRISYSTIVWFEGFLQGHNNVISTERREDIVFDIRRKRQNDTISAVIVSDYVFGEASYYKALADFQDVNAIVLVGNWNKYTLDAHTASLQVGTPLFKLKEFYAALFKDEMK